ncbi:MAG TPA: hypothetical protein VD811_14090 [Desulfuromonadales bacterium]|nr:hypothetical protein [Desulfuromonadales bacterium]
MVCKKKFNLVLLIVFCVFLSGCANHLKVETHTETEMVRDKISHAVDIGTNAGSLVTTALVNVEVQESQAFTVKTFESKAEYDVVTPYKGVLEIYEVPMGIVLLPIGVVVNVLDFATLGLLPNKITDVLLDWSFAGMNPFLNLESENRTERTLKKADKKMIDKKEEFLKKPLANTELLVSSDGAHMNITLDEFGKAEVSMVRLSALSSNIEKIALAVEAGDIKAQKDIDVSRQLRSQLQKASLITKKYAKLAAKDINEVDIQTLDLIGFSTDLIRLSELGFESESLRIEKRALELMSEEQKAVFKYAMDPTLNLSLEPAVITGSLQE